MLDTPSLITRLTRGARIAALLLLAAAAAVACRGKEGAGGPPAAGVIAEISGEPVTMAQFEAYVAGVTGIGEDGAPQEPSEELLSRLLDGFLEEEMILREARKQGVVATEREITEALRRLQHPEGGESGLPAPGADAAREKMRRALTVRRFKEEHVLKGLSVSPEEIEAYYQEHHDEFHQAARVVLRQILLDDVEEAKRVRETIARDPSRFAEIAEARSLAPDAGRPRAYEEADLPPEILAAVSAVPAGGLSEVVSDPQGNRIFLVESRQPERLVGPEEASDRIRVALLQEKGRRAYATFAGSLRTDGRLVVHEDRIPFAYRKKES